MLFEFLARLFYFFDERFISALKALHSAMCTLCAAEVRAIAIQVARQAIAQLDHQQRERQNVLAGLGLLTELIDEIAPCCAGTGIA